MKIREITETHNLWRDVCRIFPQVMKWRADKYDEGDYHFFAAVDSRANITGATAIDIGEMSFGPLKKDIIAYIEDIWVVADKNYLVKLLLNYAIKFAKARKCRHIRGQVQYKEKEILRVMSMNGFAIMPIDDPACNGKTNQYLVIKPL